RVPIDGQRKGFANANVVERLDGLVERDAEQPGRWRVLHDDLVPELLANCRDLGLRHGAELDPGTPGTKGRGPHRGVRTDEELVSVEVRPILNKVVGVPLALERGSARVTLELEGTGSDDVRLKIVRVLVEILLRIDDVPRRGEVSQ